MPFSLTRMPSLAMPISAMAGNAALAARAAEARISVSLRVIDLSPEIAWHAPYDREHRITAFYSVQFKRRRASAGRGTADQACACGQTWHHTAAGGSR